MEMY